MWLLFQEHGKILCPYCNKKISRYSLDEHVARVHQTGADEETAGLLQKTMTDGGKSVQCPKCEQQMPTVELNQHIAKEHCDGGFSDQKGDPDYEDEDTEVINDYLALL